MPVTLGSGGGQNIRGTTDSVPSTPVAVRSGSSFPFMKRSARPVGNLPSEATSFVGRRGELAELRTKLAMARLVSLVGPGGVGKTRLGLRIATELGRRFKGGAWMIELAEVRDPSLVSNAVVSALDLRDQTATEPLALLLAFLRDKELLLVVDNCEHLLVAAAQLVTEVMRAGPGVRVIATSREPLGVSGEHLLPVQPLELPSPSATEPLTRLRQNEAVLLFTERAVAASGTFELTASNRDSVVDLCRRLDGLPLAIELAAVRTRVLSVDQIRERLSDRFALLTGGSRAALPRHQTLRTAIEWSHDLLAPDERTLLRRLCVFAGRFTLEDIESVCASDDLSADGALDLLSSLVDKSLVMREDTRDVASYRLHETMREYAALKLREADEEELLDRRCAEYYRTKIQRSATESRQQLVEWLAWMDLEIDNVRSVLRRCLVNGKLRIGIDIATFLWWYWATRATTEGARWLDTFLAAARGDPQGAGWPHFMRGFLAVLQADSTAAIPALRRAVAAAHATRQPSLLSQSLSMSSIAENWAGDPAAAHRLLDEAQAVTNGLDDRPATVGLLQARALNGLSDGDLDAVRSAATEGARLSRATGDVYALDMMLLNLGLASLIAGDLDEARPFMIEGLRIAHQIDDRVAQFLWLDALGYHASRSGQPRLAARLLGAARAMRRGAGAGVNAVLAPLVVEAERSATTAIGAARFKDEFDAGGRLPRDAACALALGEPAEVADAPAEDARERLLGRRQTDVARLVAEGLTNKEIGTRLFISERTVESHVRTILNKLGYSSRAQIAGWMASSNQ
jgi:predicted ATPase/DNA-binding CsgD family transcriptional regulator